MQERGDEVVPLANEARASLGSYFSVDVDTFTDDAYVATVDEVFADGDRAVNVAALVRELAAMIAGAQPLRLVSKATFHVADANSRRRHGNRGRRRP